MGYRYEVSISSFIREHLFDLVEMDYGSHRSDGRYDGIEANDIYWKVYPQCKRDIVRVIEENAKYTEEMKVYTDGAGRNHLFITHRLKGRINENMKEICYKHACDEFPSLEKAYKFAEKFDVCPRCGQKNHPNYLINFYLDEKKRNMREQLLAAMRSEDAKKRGVKIGVLCCKCFREFMLGEIKR